MMKKIFMMIIGMLLMSNNAFAQGAAFFDNPKDTSHIFRSQEITTVNDVVQGANNIPSFPDFGIDFSYLIKPLLIYFGISIIIFLIVFIILVYIAKWIFRMNEIVMLLDLIASHLGPNKQEVIKEEVHSEFASKSVGQNESE